MLKYRTLIRFLVKAGHVKPKFVALKPISPNFHYRMVKELVLKRTKSSEICINVPECWFASFNRHLFLTIKTLNWTNIKGLFLAGLLKVIFKLWSIDLASHVLICAFGVGGEGGLLVKIDQLNIQHMRKVSFYAWNFRSIDIVMISIRKNAINVNT